MVTGHHIIYPVEFNIEIGSREEDLENVVDEVYILEDVKPTQQVVEVCNGLFL